MKDQILPEQDQAKIADLKKQLTIVDGWIYFVITIFLAFICLIFLIDSFSEDKDSMLMSFGFNQATSAAIWNNLQIVAVLFFFVSLLTIIGLFQRHFWLRKKIGLKGVDNLTDLLMTDMVNVAKITTGESPNLNGKPRVFIIHGWGGKPEEAWFPWLKKKLEAKGISVYVPAMPDTEHPAIDKWVPYLAAQVGWPDTNTYLVGHSIGVQTILRYLQTLDRPVGGVVAVAGFFTLIPGSLDGPGEEKQAKPWLETPIDTDKVKQNTNKIIAIFSDTDKFVGLENVDYFKKRLGAQTFVLNKKGHMGSSDGIQELPEILEAVEEIMK